ncbi:MAG TPA: hypothetical protein PLM33_07430 [Acidobacteriota bacterium]|nr:hypothetical protein [Acidobacteriota bacterium]
MNPYAITLLCLTGLLLLVLPRRWAPLPLLVGTCYITQAQGIEIGPFSFPFLRLLILVGFVRLLLRREWKGVQSNRLDGVFLLWAVWALLSAIWHKDPGGELVYRMGLVYDYLGLYFIFRSFLRSLDDLVRVATLTAVLLLPVASEMIYEKVTAHNLFSYFGGVPPTPTIREGNLRAQGPFRHAILAGTVGAVMFPWMVGLWRFRRGAAFWGGTACLVMVVTCRSSGPVGSLLAALVGLAFWRFRDHMRFVRWAALLGYVALDVVMKAPAYYLIARVDFAGGSTGWHRARLIESAIEHIGDWWWAGTDYTRHWMPTGVSWSPDHSDITNHYLHFGVIGGLPLLLLFVLILWEGFKNIGLAIRERAAEPGTRFLIWAVGASLFANAVTCLAVSYFDQSFLFLCLTLAATRAGAATYSNASTPDAEENILASTL